MSAYVVQDKTINKIISKLRLDRNGQWMLAKIKQDTGLDLNDNSDATIYGKSLLLMNIDAVNQRYSEHEDGTAELDSYKFKLEINHSKMNAYKAISCYLYQCSEGDVPNYALYRQVEDIKHSWAGDLVRSMPEYETAGGWD